VEYWLLEEYFGGLKVVKQNKVMNEDKDKTEQGSSKAAIYSSIAGGFIGIAIGSVILVWLLRKVLKNK